MYVTINMCGDEGTVSHATDGPDSVTRHELQRKVRSPREMVDLFSIIFTAYVGHVGRVHVLSTKVPEDQPWVGDLDVTTGWKPCKQLSKCELWTSHIFRVAVLETSAALTSAAFRGLLHLPPSG